MSTLRSFFTYYVQSTDTQPIIIQKSKYILKQIRYKYILRSVRSHRPFRFDWYFRKVSDFSVQCSRMFVSAFVPLHCILFGCSFLHRNECYCWNKLESWFELRHDECIVDLWHRIHCICLICEWILFSKFPNNHFIARDFFKKKIIHLHWLVQSPLFGQWTPCIWELWKIEIVEKKMLHRNCWHLIC